MYERVTCDAVSVGKFYLFLASFDFNCAAASRAFNQIIQQLLGKMGLDRKLCTTDFSRILRAFLRWILKIPAESAHYLGVTIEMRLSIRMMVMI